jgi:hypothetical protein
MTEPVPGHIIKAVCDDPRHARNKVAKVATFGRFTLRNGEVRWFIRDDAGEWRYTRPDPAGVYRRYGADADKGSTYVWTCKLCSRSLEVREGTLHQLLEDTYQGLLITRPGERVSPVSVKALRLVASQVAPQQ